MLKIPKAYSYLYDIVKQICANEHVSVDEIDIVGGRKSGKTMSVEIFFSVLCLILTKKPNVRIAVFLWRYGVEEIKEFYNDFLETVQLMDIPYKKDIGNKTITIGQTCLRFYGLSKLSKSKAKKSGLAKAGEVNYIFNYFEEAYEFPLSDYRSLKEAVRGINTMEIQMLDFNVCNPWSKQNWFIKRLTELQPWDLNKMKNEGQQIGIYSVETKDHYIDDDGNIKEFTVVKRILIHYTNWRVIKNLLGESDIREILDTWKYDRNRAMTTDYGLPGYETGAIYTHELHKIGRCIYQSHDYLWGGGDYGWSQFEAGGKTVFLFGGATLGNGVDVYGEYLHDNALRPKPVNLLVSEVVDFYVEQMSAYIRRVGLYEPQFLKVNVDNMSNELIAMLNNEAKNRRLSMWLRFAPCAKFQIQDRIVFELGILANSLLRLNPQVTQLKSDFETSTYAELDTQKRIKKYDHALNAFEYGSERFMYAFSKMFNSNSIRYKIN